jgi:hypothetical protein
MSNQEVIVIRDRGERLELHRRLINGVEVYTPTKEKSQELDERFKKMVPRSSKTKSSRQQTRD